MRLTIIYLLILAAAGTILFLSKDYEIKEEEKRINTAKEYAENRRLEDSLERAEEIAKEKAFFTNRIEPYLSNPFMDSIDLSGFELEKLPKGFIDSMKNMKYLNLSNNNFRQLPDEILKHPTLEILDCSDNKIIKIRTIRSENLKKLYLRNAGLLSLPEIKYFPNLEYLDISNNSINYNANFDDAKCPNLKYINISNNRIMGIRGIGGFTGLEVLIAKDNVIEGIPEFLYNEELRYLDLSNNSIMNFTFPKYSEILLKLTTVKLNDNDIKSIHSNVALSNLEHLELRNNELNYILALGIKVNYPNLTYMDITGNKIEDNNIKRMSIDTLIH